MTRARKLLAVSVVVAAIAAFVTTTTNAQDYPSTAHLFQPCPNITVHGPTQFPHPLHSKLGKDAQVIVKPTWGQHNRVNAAQHGVILAYAEGYQLSYYMMFLETLTATGYRGDVVLAIASHKLVREHVEDYLQRFTRGNATMPNLVVYQQDLVCASDDGPSSSTQRRVMKQGDFDVFQMCQMGAIYGVPSSAKSPNGGGNTNKMPLQPVPDPRPGRVVATLRYEWYWIWAQQYSSHTWLMLLDARDSYFQSDPLAHVPKRQQSDDNNNGPADGGGLLYFFGENSAATRLGKSTKNRKWLLMGYGQHVCDALHAYPTICSGSTMGEQVAVETYLRAMINEHDENHIKMTGSDQGFHNYLYYSSKLANAESIARIVVWEQGRGAINNLGALRTKPLADWGIYRNQRIYQWDNVTVSPVVHQWDRDHDLHAWMWGQRHRTWRQQYEEEIASG